MTDPAARRALEHVGRELREAPLPAIDWERLEAVLEQRLAAPPRAAAPRLGWPLLAAAVSVAGLGGLWLAWTHAPRPAPPSADHVNPAVGGATEPSRVVATTPGVALIDGETLVVGDALDAPAGGLEVTHGQRVVWTLAPGGRARIQEIGQRLTIALVSGSLRAEVAPGSAPEIFAVEVDGTRIAVHGTIFRVERGADRVAVAVERGAVVVLPAQDRGRNPGLIVAAPERRAFSLAGLPVARPDGAADASASGAPGAVHRAPPSRKTAVLTAPSAFPARPGELEAAAYGVTGAVQRCFATHTPAVAEGHVTAEVGVSLLVAPDGRLLDLAFAPPLAPAVAGCSQSAARQVRLPAPGVETRIERTLSLVR